MKYHEEDETGEDEILEDEIGEDEIWEGEIGEDEIGEDEIWEGEIGEGKVWEGKIGQVVGGPFDGAGVLGGRDWGDVCWWGWSEAHKWRWHGTHIDLGPVSIYELKRLWLWRLVAILIKPLRMWYHWRYYSRKSGPP